MRKWICVVILIVLFGIVPGAARAVIPPDFVFNIGAQIAQFFSMIVLFFAAVFGTLTRFFSARFASLRHKKSLVIVGVVVCLAVAAGASYWYAVDAQRREYIRWLEESRRYSSGVIPTEPPSTPTDLPLKFDETAPSEDARDQLVIHESIVKEDRIGRSSEPFLSRIQDTDPVGEFIIAYYRDIAMKHFDQAYIHSSQEVNKETFLGWYAETDAIVVDKLVRIDPARSSLELTLYEGDTFTRYGVVMMIRRDQDIPVRVENSHVTILAHGVRAADALDADMQNAIEREDTFFEDHEVDAGTSIGNSEFQQYLQSSRDQVIVLDAREDSEYENGHFPESVHIRFADLKAGRWIEVPNDRSIVVICWSGIRGKEVAEFLRTKKIVARYLETGASGWVASGGSWVGSVYFTDTYSEGKYQRVLDTSEVKEQVSKGVVLVDTRDPYTFQKKHILGSVNIPIMYTPTLELDDAFAQVPAGSTVITVCDGYVNCFDAKLTGVELERRGNIFVGRYNRPWEYETD